MKPERPIDLEERMMIKTIKVKKQLRLDELIKYIFENGIKGNTHLIDYQSNLKTNVFVDFSGQVAVQGSHFGNELFTVEVEEEITEDTVLEHTVIVLSGNEIIVGKHVNTSIKAIKHRYATVEQIHTLVENKLELIWEAEEE